MMSYLLFAGDHYYPSGGWHDFVDSFSSEDAAVKHAASLGNDWWHVVCGGEIVASGNR